MARRKTARSAEAGGTSTKAAPRGAKGNRGNRKSAATVPRATVPQILRQIDRLSEPDRLRLEKTLAQRVEAEWLREARRARRLAAKRGIDQAAIDRAVEDVRYPKRVNGDRG